MGDQATVSLLRWLRRQLREPAEARRLLETFDFTPVQRDHVERLIDEWERSRAGR